MNIVRLKTVRRGFLLLALLACLPARAAEFPPLVQEISPERPLFIFPAPEYAHASDDAYAAAVVLAWSGLPESLRPFSVFSVDALSLESPEERYQAWLPVLQQAGVPLVLRVSNGTPQKRLGLDPVRRLISSYTLIKGVETAGFRFDRYDIAGQPSGELPPDDRYLMDLFELSASYGRFVYWPMEGLHWARMMARPETDVLREKMAQCRGYVIPSCVFRGHQPQAALGATLGLWLENTAGHWGVCADAQWYGDAGFNRVNVFGAGAPLQETPPGLYRAMIYLGAMGGAEVYQVQPADALWYGNNFAHWNQAVYPALREIVRLGAVARRDFVLKETRLALLLSPASDPAQFRNNLQDIDPVLGEGRMMAAAYGAPRPGQMPELIPNTSRHYWIPLLSAGALAETLQQFEKVILAGTLSPEAWQTLLQDYIRRPQPEGEAYQCHIGRAVFIMNTQENLDAKQSFVVANAPAPVRQFSARRTPEGVTLTWPFRENDVAYNVYRRTLPDGAYEPLALNLDERSHTDSAPPPDQRVAYSITALTNEFEPYQGAVSFGEFLCVSSVESRMVEEIRIDPALTSFQSIPMATPTPAPAPPAAPWWPGLEGVPEANRPDAEAVAARLEQWDAAIQAKSLEGALELYAAAYQDAGGWRKDYVRRAFMALFQGYDTLRVHRQIRRWEFLPAAPGAEAPATIKATAYWRVAAGAVSDASGVTANPVLMLPRDGNGEITFTFVQEEGAWRIAGSEPAFPNFRDLLAAQASPYQPLPPGPDVP